MTVSHFDNILNHTHLNLTLFWFYTKITTRIDHCYQKIIITAPSHLNDLRALILLFRVGFHRRSPQFIFIGFLIYLTIKKINQVNSGNLVCGCQLLLNSWIQRWNNFRTLNCSLIAEDHFVVCSCFLASLVWQMALI